MTRTEIDLTDSAQFDVDITKSGNVVTIEMTTNSGKGALVLDMCDFIELVREGCLMVNRKVSA